MVEPGKSLVKFCEEKHNLAKACRTVRLGTLSYFRNLESKDGRADEKEGIEQLSVNFLLGGTEDPATSQEFSRAFGGSPGKGNAYVECTGGVEYPNSYIWCCSMVYPQGERGLNIGTGLSPDYKSEYPVGDPSRFSGWLSYLVKTNLTTSCLSDKSQKAIASLRFNMTSNLQCLVVHGPVVYVDRKTTHIDESIARSYAPNLPVELRPAFTKPLSYKHECEYRFLIAVVHQTLGILSVSDQPVSVPITPVHQALQS